MGTRLVRASARASTMERASLIDLLPRLESHVSSDCAYAFQNYQFEGKSPSVSGMINVLSRRKSTSITIP